MTELSTRRSLPIALLRARESVMQNIRPMLNNIGLTEQKWRVLRSLNESGEVEQTAIARDACLLLPSLTRILKSLEEDGFVGRAQDQGDKRRTLVSITAKGRNLVQENLGMADKVNADLEQKLGREKLEQLLDLLDDLQGRRT